MNLKITGYAEIGYLPAANNALSTSVAFHVLTNQILEVAIKNQTEYRITKPINKEIMNTNNE